MKTTNNKDRMAKNTGYGLFNLFVLNVNKPSFKGVFLTVSKMKREMLLDRLGAL